MNSFLSEPPQSVVRPQLALDDRCWHFCQTNWLVISSPFGGEKHLSSWLSAVSHWFSAIPRFSELIVHELKEARMRCWCFCVIPRSRSRLTILHQLWSRGQSTWVNVTVVNVGPPKLNRHPVLPESYRLKFSYLSASLTWSTWLVVIVNRAPVFDWYNRIIHANKLS